MLHFKIPVYKGAAKTLLPIPDNVHTTFHGGDGMGDLDYENEPDLQIQEKPAAIAMYDIVKRNPGQIDLICLAPLTNVALAIRLYDDFVSYLKGIYIMGGNNTGSYNFYCYNLCQTVFFCIQPCSHAQSSQFNYAIDIFRFSSSTSLHLFVHVKVG